MKITVEKDDGTIEVFQNITDGYLAIRYTNKVMYDNDLVHITQSSSYSWGSNIRELVKELQQSLVELQDFLREQTHGNSG